MVKSALSSMINQQENVCLDNTRIVKRYIKGIFENNPTLSKFQFTWSSSLVCNSLSHMQEIQALDI